MNIRRSGYEGMDWLKALEAANKPKDPTADLGQQNESDLVNEALESTAKIAFDLPVSQESKYDALKRSSKEIADKSAVEMKMAAAKEIRDKMSNEGIDPISLGVNIREADGKQRPITKEEWEGASDVRFVEKVATQAALEYEKQAKRAWENDALKPAQQLNSKYDPMTMRDGRIMSSTAMNEETTGRKSQIPANAASMFDPFKLDRFANTETSHDKAVREKREAVKAREEEKKAALKPKEDPNTPDPMRHGQITRSGGEDSAVFQQRTPKNQLSMLDIHGTEKLSAEEMKERLEQLFTRVEDNGQKIREANKERLDAIKGKQEKDRSWEKLDKPMSTSQLSNNLVSDELAQKFAKDAPKPEASAAAPKLSPSELQQKLSELFSCPKKQDGR